MSSPESRRRLNSSEENPAPLRPTSRRRSARPAPEPQEPVAGQARDNQRGSESASLPGYGPVEVLSGWSFRDFLVPYILLALSMQRAHGYFIEQYLRGLGLANLEMSTLYRTLRQLEKDGLVNSTWEPGPEGPARRIYSLTDTGRWWLDAGAVALAGYRSIIDRFFGSYSGPTQGGEQNGNEKGDSR